MSNRGYQNNIFPKATTDLTKIQINKIKSNYKQYQYFRQQQKKKFKTSPELYCYIVSTTYLRQFKQFVYNQYSTKFLPHKMNYDLVDAGGVLKQNLRQNVNYQILPQSLYKLIKIQQCVGYELQRQAFFRGTKKIIPIYDTLINFILMQEKKSIGKIQYRQFPLKCQPKDTVQNIINIIKNNRKIDKKKQIKLYTTFENSSIIKYHLQHNIQLDAKPIKQLNTKICSLQLDKIKCFIAKIMDVAIPAIPDQLTAQSIKPCSYCNKYKQLLFSCKCQQVSYCSQQCGQKHKFSHLKSCSLSKYQQQASIDMEIAYYSKKGEVGLYNLGNTCFMNSCLQCLSHTKPLTNYFLKKYYTKQINQTNPLGSKGKIANSYAQFIKNMWCGQSSIYDLTPLKRVFDKINPYFQGHHPHDSQQFFTFLVDGIHEDLNRVIEKPYVKQIQDDNKEDKIIALQSWKAYTKRNQSIIVDLMTGQCKSKVTCPTCTKISTTFDSFTTLSLPIPKKYTIKYFVIFKYHEKCNKLMSFITNKLNVKQWLGKASELLNKKPQQFVFYILTKDEICPLQKFDKTQLLQKLQHQQPQIHLLQLTDQEQLILIKNKLQIPIKYCYKQKYYNEYRQKTLKLPYFFDKNNVSIKIISQRILAQLYSIFNSYQHLQLKQYLAKYQKNLPFMLSLKYDKKIRQYSYTKQIIFNKNITLNNDSQINLIQFLNKLQPDSYQLDVIITTSNLFVFKKWNQYQPIHSINNSMSGKIKNNIQQEVTLDQCFQLFSEEQQLQQGNQWLCPLCQQPCKAIKKMQIYKIPQILIIHLKRFKIKNSKKSKSGINVKFPFLLDMKKYIIDSNPMLTYIKLLKKQQKQYKQPPYCDSIKFDNQSTQYQLYAVNNHLGQGWGFGHYIAYAKNSDKWIQYDDGKLFKASQQIVKNSSAYMLFYKRKDSSILNN